MSFQNGVIYQPFSWYDPPDPPLWETLAHDAATLAHRGYSAVWLPPPCKAKGGVHDVGYGIYDLFDLGEFHAHGTVRTKYGTRQQLADAVDLLQAAGLAVYVDTVFNHKDGGDETEVFLAQLVDRHDRNRALSDWFDIRGWTRFTFPGRGEAYSSMKWNWRHFDCLSYNQDRPDHHDDVYRIKDKHFETQVSGEFGNYDYLMACDLETINPQVEHELRRWGEWIINTLGVDGFRLDAIKHIRARFFLEWLNHLRQTFAGEELFTFGEYWATNVNDLHRYLAATEDRMSLFDVPLHYNFYNAGRAGSGYDLRRIFDDTLVAHRPTKAVTFVDNHDTQPMRSLESWVEPWFKPLAYALILLRRDGYPCVFAADCRESDYDNGQSGDARRWARLYDHSHLIHIFLKARREYAYGDQYDYLDHPSTIGWTRLGDPQHPGAMAVVLGNGSEGDKWMEVRRASATFTDATGHFTHKVTTNEQGWGHFPCKGGKVSVWLQE